MVDPGIMAKLTTVLRDVFDDDQVTATPGLTAQQVKGWDSLGNVRLFVEIERAFGVRFGAAEIGSLHDVGELAALIAVKIRDRSQVHPHGGSA